MIYKNQIESQRGASVDPAALVEVIEVGNNVTAVYPCGKRLSGP